MCRPPQPIITYIIIHITSHHTNTNTTPHTMSMHGISIMFTPSCDVVDPTGDIVAQINGETEAQPVAAAAAAPEPPAPVAAPAAQDLLDTARARLKKRLDFITAVNFEKESKSLDFRCWVEGGEIRVKLLDVDTKGANTGVTKIPEAGEPGFGMPVEMLANLVLQKTIPAIMENEKEAIQKYLKA